MLIKQMVCRLIAAPRNCKSSEAFHIPQLAHKYYRRSQCLVWLLDTCQPPLPILLSTETLGPSLVVSRVFVWEKTILFDILICACLRYLLSLSSTGMLSKSLDFFERVWQNSSSSPLRGPGSTRTGDYAPFEPCGQDVGPSPAAAIDTKVRDGKGHYIVITDGQEKNLSEIEYEP